MSSGDFYLRITHNILKRRSRKNIFHKIIKKYSRPVKRDDVIDLKRMVIVENNGYLARKKPRPFGFFPELCGKNAFAVDEVFRPALPSTSSGHGQESVSNLKLITKRRYISDDSSSSEDEIKPVLKRRRIIVSSDDEDEEEIKHVLKRRRIVSSDESSESFSCGSPALPAAEFSSPIDSPVSSPRHSPLPPAAMPQHQGRCRGRPPKQKCMRQRDSVGRFMPDPNLIRDAQRPKRKRRTELELLLSYSYSCSGQF